MASHDPTKLPGKNPPRVMNQLFGEYCCRRQVVARLGDTSHHGRDCWPVLRPWDRGIEGGWSFGSPRQHDVMAERMVVRGVRERTHQRPQVTALSELRQMLANVEARRFRRDGMELTANIVGSQRLRIEAIVLRQSTREKDVNHRPRRSGSHRCSRGLAQCGHMIRPEAQQAHAPHLESRAARDTRMNERAVFHDRLSLTGQPFASADPVA